MNNKRVLLIIPAYNEEENIGNVLDNLKSQGYLEMTDVLVINDSSKDKTLEVVQSRSIDVVTQVYNMGYGAALQTGYKYATEKGYDYVMQMDADGQHDLKNLDIIYEKLVENKNADIIIGSRFLEGSQSFKVSGLKIAVIKMFRAIIKNLTGASVTDPTSGLQGLNRKAFSYYAQFTNFDLKYSDINMLLQMLLLGFKIEEIPAIMHSRTAGVSMHTGWWKAFKYMIFMALSSLGVVIRSHGRKNV